jgi:nucleolar MIF4G domain-containing protein 1
MVANVFKQILNFAYLQPKTKSFLEIVLSTAFKHLFKRSKESAMDDGELNSAITGMLMRAKDTPQVITGLQYFLSKEANLLDIASSSSERKTMKKVSKISILVLTQLSSLS